MLIHFLTLQVMGRMTIGFVQRSQGSTEAIVSRIKLMHTVKGQQTAIGKVNVVTTKSPPRK